MRAGKVVVRCPDTGIDHRDIDSRAIEPDVLTHGVGTNRRTGAFERGEYRAIKGNARDHRTVRKRRQRAVWRFGDASVDDRQVPTRSAPSVLIALRIGIGRTALPTIVRLGHAWAVSIAARDRS